MEEDPRTIEGNLAALARAEHEDFLSVLARLNLVVARLDDIARALDRLERAVRPDSRIWKEPREPLF